MRSKKGESDDLVYSNLFYLILIVVFVVLMMFVVYQQRSGAGVWERYYAGEFVKAVDFSRPGDEVCLDVHKATEIAQENEVRMSEIFSFDNSANEFCIKLSKGRMTCLDYFNDVDVLVGSGSLNLGTGEEGRNFFCFDVVEGGEE